jgi:hypothetical protein
LRASAINRGIPLEQLVGKANHLKVYFGQFEKELLEVLVKEKMIKPRGVIIYVRENVSSSLYG